MTGLIKLPRRFFDDHAERDLDTPKVVKSTRRHYFIASDDPALPELASDAEYYAGSGSYMEFHLQGLCRSATATADAIYKARPDLDQR